MEARLDENLRDVSFEDLQKLRQELGSKAYAETIFGNSETRRNKKKDYKRANKNRPREESSKVPVSAVRNVFHVEKREVRDPRFDEKAGIYDERVFKQTYEFLDSVKAKEKQKLIGMLISEKNPEAQQELKFLLDRISNQERTEAQKAKERERKAEERRKWAQEFKEGRNPFYKKKSEEKHEKLVEQYLQLKKSGKIEKYLMKKRKKQLAKDRKKIPL